MKLLTCMVLIGITIALTKGQISPKSCTNNEDCNDENTECKNNKCKCKISFRNGSNQKCIPVHGSVCEGKDECENLPGAICQNNHCVCLAGQLAGVQECIKIGEKDDPCTNHADCIHRNNMIDNERECRTDKCVCKSNWHEASNLKCVPNKGLKEQCNKDECYLQVGDKNGLSCKDNICECADGYKEEKGTCNGSGNNSIFPAMTLLFIVIGIHKYFYN